MTYRVRRAAAVAGLLLAGPDLSTAGMELAGAGPIEDAREAARRVPFSARVEVTWVDRSGLHTAELGVRAVGGHVLIQGLDGATRGEDTTVLQANGRSLPSGSEVDAGGLLTPTLERNYALVRRAGPLVAGRETEEVVLRRNGEVRERLAMDKATGLVLQREVLGPDGQPVRVVRVLQLDTAPVPETVAAGDKGAGKPHTLRVSSLSSAYPAPPGLAGGYRRVAAYRHARMVHLVYSDGLHGLSLFSQPGALRVRALPGGGEMVRVGTSTGLRYTWPGGEVVTWQSGPMVHTLIGDGTAEDLVAAARSLPPPGRPSLLARVRGTARLVTELISGGR